MKIKFFTLGCKVNQYETQLLREFFVKRGFKETDDFRADFYVINTCTVTHTADIKSLKLIRRLKRKNHQARILVTGCLAEKDRGLIEGEEVDFIVGQSHKLNWEYLESLLSKDSGFLKPEEEDFKSGIFLRISDFVNHQRAFLKIQDGCNQRCSYCKVRVVRGPSVSKPVFLIKKELRTLIEKGFKEIVLCGTNIASWQSENKEGLGELLIQIEKVLGAGRIRLSSLEPRYITEELIKIIASSPKFCPHFHLSFQSGDDKILKLMNKDVDSSFYLKLVEKIRKIIPSAGISCDIIVNFPYEKEENFQNTLCFLKEVLPVKVHLFPFSSRSFTRADSFEYKNRNLTSERMRVLSELSSLLSYNFCLSQMGRSFKVVVDERIPEEICLGYTENYIRVKLRDKVYPSKELIPVRLFQVKETGNWARVESIP